MQCKLKYGVKELSVCLRPEHKVEILELNDKLLTPKTDIKREFLRALNRPLNNKKLSEIILKKKIKNVVIVLEDFTRANPYYPQTLSLLVEELLKQSVENIKFLIALGSHRPHTKQDNIRLYGKNLVEKYEFINHDCNSLEANIYIGKTSLGNKIFVNKYAALADLIILTGSIDTHTFAGYTGTRKAIVPGIAYKETIRFNHSFVVDPKIRMGDISENIINKDMLEAARLFSQKRNVFVVNFIKDDKKRLIKVLCGDINSVYNLGIKLAKKLFSVRISKLSDVTIVSCGGYPRDIDLYQAQKSLTAATLATKRGGSIILVAECSEGVGQRVFAKWLLEKDIDEIISCCPQDIELEGHRAFLTARILRDFYCILVSKIKKNIVKKMKFDYAKDINEAISKVEKKCEKNLFFYIIPNGSSVLPVYKGSNKN